jgi:protein-tyrosine phosphatase
LKNSEVQVIVSMLTQSETEELGLTLEPEECHACGIEFLNFPIEDRGLPTNVLEFKKFVEQIAKLLGEGKSVAVHCRAGIGRSSLLACSVLVRLGIAGNHAWLLVQEARGCPVPDTAEQRVFVDRLVKM